MPTSKGPKCFNKCATDPPGEKDGDSNSGEEREGEILIVTEAVTVTVIVTVTAAETVTVAEVRR